MVNFTCHIQNFTYYMYQVTFHKCSSLRGYTSAHWSLNVHALLAQSQLFVRGPVSSPQSQLTKVFVHPVSCQSRLPVWIRTFLVRLMQMDPYISRLLFQRSQEASHHDPGSAGPDVCPLPQHGEKTKKYTTDLVYLHPKSYTLHKKFHTHRCKSVL